MEMEVTNQNAEYMTVGRCLIVKVNGDLDHCRADVIRRQTDVYLYRGNIKYVLFDVSEVDFCDSSGIGLIAGRYKKVKLVGGSVALIGIKEATDRIFRTSGIYRIAEQFMTMEEALFCYQSRIS